MHIRQCHVRSILLLLSYFMVTTSYADEQKPLKLCSLPMFSEISIEHAELAMTTIFNRQMADLGISISYKVYPTAEALLNGFDKEECDGMVASAVEILARKNQLDDLIIAVADWVYKGTNVYSYVVVTNNMNANKLEDLEGKTITNVINRPFSKVYLEYVLLKSKRKDFATFFKVMPAKKDPQTAIMDVFFGKADAAVVDQLALETASELNPQITKKLKVILKSPLFYNALIGFRNSAPRFYPLAYKVFKETPQSRLSLDKLDTSFSKHGGRGEAFKLESLQKKDLSEMEAIINEINTIKKGMK
jgi:ABC-type phosphate/phosphonate transport system substrate-binding protein